MPHALFQDLHRPPFQRLRSKPDRPVNQLHVLVAKLLEKLIKFRQGLRHHVRIVM